jgi:signal transduction histidine kinase
MTMRLSHTQLLRYAGLFTWAMVGVPLFYTWWTTPSGPESDEVWRALRWPIIGFLVFGGAYWLVTRELARRRSRWFDIVLLAVLTGSALFVSYMTGTGLSAILLMIVAGVIPWLLPLYVGIPWLVIQHLALIPVFKELPDFNFEQAVLQALLYIGYSSFAFVTGLVAMQQAQAREEQRRLNAELRATRVLLAESSRMSERLRISRELHDLLGHHLTALSLNLEVAGHLTEGKAQDHVRQSHTLARLLLTDVREAVSEMREERGVDVAAALRTLVEGVPSLDVRLDLPEMLRVDDPERANVLLRCAQEIITNAVRHAGASRLDLKVEPQAGTILLQARDDGRGSDSPTPGNGLRGMRERLAACGGHLDIITAPGQGFALDVRLPLENDP